MCVCVLHGQPPAADDDAQIQVPLGPEHFELLRIIGEGAFGKVIQVRNRVDNQIYAMKAISKKLLRKKNHVAYMKAERDILTKVKERISCRDFHYTSPLN